MTSTASRFADPSPIEASVKPLATQLADAVVALQWTDVPLKVRETAKEHLLDAVGLALAATTLDFGSAIHEAGVRLDGAKGSGVATVLGFGSGLTPAYAALVNGTLMHGLDFDDTHIGAIYHATAPAAAAALAVGEEVGATGTDLLLAYIVGLEVGCRLAKAGAGRFHLRGFHPTGVIGTFAAACVAAKLRHTDAPTLHNALGLCGSQAAGILELHDSWLKRMHPGWAAHAAISAVTMAQAGFRGPATVFEGEGGLYQAHIGEKPTAADLAIADIGDVWWTPDIALKPYPCCHFTHAFVDAAANILGDLKVDRLTADDVAEITCTVPAMVIPMVCEPRDRKIAPPAIYDALFSVPYVTAARLLGRSMDLAMFYDQPLDDPDTLALAAKVSCTPDPDTAFPWHFPGTVSVTLQDGRTPRSHVADSRGTKEHPLAREEILAKFDQTAGRTMAGHEARRLGELLLELEQHTTADLMAAATLDS
ncbi:MmgE/PrpD family protein [Amycolatopsis sp. H20-H5]|uniref:MmgE/PrpD family protein n=1 Tax=Amycolatopsis sp. H20-H5 TaxID=3046309 RepID=UPI002DBFCFC7|nr:MmgE/PrpD family protein [Amycolatopsis sp. H20-H5]MEC3980083.1 MmgE/PrpD family protein [Amycolatopsis sp. H20-H5]